MGKEVPGTKDFRKEIYLAKYHKGVRLKLACWTTKYTYEYLLGQNMRSPKLTEFALVYHSE